MVFLKEFFKKVYLEKSDDKKHAKLPSMQRVKGLKKYLSRNMRFPTMWYVRPAKALTSLRICAVWSESLPVAWKFYDTWAADRTSFGVSKLKRRLHRLVWVYTCQNTTLLEITCHGDWSWNNFYDHSPPFRWIIHEGLLSVTSESMCTNYWLTACSSLPRKKGG